MLFPQLKRQSVAIEKVQRRATKLIPALKDLDYKERMRQLKLPTLKYRRYRGDLIQVFKTINGIDVLKFEDFFTTTKHDSTRNSEHNLYVHFTKTKTRKFAFSNRVAPTWNSLLHPVTTTQHLSWKNCTGFPFQNVLSIQSLVCVSVL